MISVGIIGGSGYTGKKLIQFCNDHPFVEEYKIYANTSAGLKIVDIFPDLFGMIEDQEILSSSELSYEHDAYFIALPHGEALNYVPLLAAMNKKIIDLGGDYRFDSSEEYFKWYGKTHNSAELLNEKVYGLADYKNTNYFEKFLISNPGCYPTAALLSLLPLIKIFSSEINTISVTSYSGTSGAGKSPKLELMMSEMSGNATAYNVNKHRHEPEILQQLKEAGFNSPFSFTTHLLPVSIGIYSTSSVHLNKNISREDIENIYSEFYKNSFFVRMRETPPQLAWVVNSNFCDINISVNEKVVIITAAIDNLIKGASGQAIQNMNKLFRWDETLGIINKGDKNVSVYR
jgi:N-acetyl-gamma-glutamyl-phosphate reductase